MASRAYKLLEINIRTYWNIRIPVIAIIIEIGESGHLQK